MTGTIPRVILESVEASLRREEAELSRAAAARANRVVAQHSSGSGNIDQVFGLNLAFRLVCVRAHFAGGKGKAELSIFTASGQGAAHNTTLFTVRRAGVGADVNFRLSADETAPPSPWSVPAGDAIGLRWTNPDPGHTTWGVEVGLAPG